MPGGAAAVECAGLQPPPAYATSRGATGDDVLGPVAVAVVTGLAALLIALPVGLFAGPLGRRLALLDFPDTDGGRKRHAGITPLVGGIALAASALAACVLTVWLLPAGPWVVQHLIWLGSVTAAMYVVGFFDDRFHLSPLLRLALAIVALLLALVYAPDFSLGFLRFAGQDSIWPLGSLGDGFALLCLVGLLNSVNMADGKNGIILCLGLVWTAVLACHLPLAFLPVLVGIGVALAVLLWFNMHGRLFMGDGGSYAMSALFGLLSIYAYNNDFAVMRADEVAVMFAIPVFDTVRLMTVRVISGRSPFLGDRDHLHHHLHQRFGWPRGLMVYVALVAVPNAAALLLPGTGLVWLGVSLACYALVMWATRWRGLPSPAA